MNETEPSQESAVKQLTKAQRRVLGVLVEKAFTTPDAYPLTLKATTTGSNQKSNRHPLTNFDEPQTYDALDQLREMGLVAFVHTESGRTERYRHYMRQKFPFTEPQLAVIVELLLRGRQTLGDLRARASRMVPIDSLEQLRDEVQGLIQLGYVQSNGALERRGVEVDHAFYLPGENRTMSPMAAGDDDDSTGSTTARVSLDRSPSDPSVPVWEELLASLQDEHQQLRGQVEDMKADLARLTEQVDQLRRDLGV